MPDAISPDDLIETYLQADYSAGSVPFKSFLQALKIVGARDGQDVARTWAARAVKPQLSYFAMLSLRRWLVPADSPVPDGRPLRLAVMGGSTLTQLSQLIETFLASEGIDAEIFEAEYGVFRQEILGSGSALDKFQPQLVLLATGSRDISRYPEPGMTHDDVRKLADEEIAEWRVLWETANRRWGATIIQNNFEIMPGGIFGHYALRHAAARENFLDRMNHLFSEHAPGFVVLHDLRGLAADSGASDWFDQRFYFEAKMPCGAESLVNYAHSCVSLIRAIAGKSKKVLVLDLDNTLWGGQVGDAGPGGLRLGNGSADGEAFLAFQQYAKQLRGRGVVLAVCSKNDDDKARQPFLVCREMVLGLSDISCFVANWKNKADNLREIANRLDLGLDSFVFFDDNPMERALVRRLAPAVAVPDVPEDPTGYVAALAQYRFFETVSFTKEDQNRATFYAENASRQEMSAQATNIETFLAALNMQGKVEPINEINIERASQLINKSNQFNLTTRRYTLAELRVLVQSNQWHTMTISLRDKLGDSGLISVLLLHVHSDVLTVDSWVMSCRVLQRSVEMFVFNQILGLAQTLGAKRIRGIFIPTPKNQMVADHYPSLGFGADGAEGPTTYWALELDESIQPLDTYIEMELENE